MKKQNKKTASRQTEKKNLSIINHGDTIVIKNRSTIAAGVLGALMLSIILIGTLSLRNMWSTPVFWVIIAVMALSTAWSIVKMIFGKVVLNSPNMTMEVYNPIKKQYKFADINYVDLKTSKEKDGVVLHKVTVYIGEGKRSVEISTGSKSQADELVSLLRGMLDNGAMEYPEGNEEPFNLDEKKEKNGLFGLRLLRKHELSESESSPDAKESAQAPKEELTEEASDDEKAKKEEQNHEKGSVD